MSETYFECDATQAERFAHLALDCIHREFPNKIAHALNSYSDVKAPRELTPAFFGCYDWHSAVHSHWVLVRLTRLFTQSAFSKAAKQALDESFTEINIAQEVRYLTAEGREAFERPYGLAWLLQLAAELKEWDTSQARVWSEILAPLESSVRHRLAAWLTKLQFPNRTGEHNNTAFTANLMLNYAQATGQIEFADLIKERLKNFFLKDQNCPISYEPSGEDFLSPCLSEADVVRRLLPAEEFSSWLSTFLPQIDLTPTYPTEAQDGKSGHLLGLNLSRAWMLIGIASALPRGDARRDVLISMASKLKEAGFAGINDTEYRGAHWLGTFAVYLLTGRSL